MAARATPERRTPRSLCLGRRGLDVRRTLGITCKAAATRGPCQVHPVVRWRRRREHPIPRTGTAPPLAEGFQLWTAWRAEGMPRASANAPARCGASRPWHLRHDLWPTHAASRIVAPAPPHGRWHRVSSKPSLQRTLRISCGTRMNEDGPRSGPSRNRPADRQLHAVVSLRPCHIRHIMSPHGPQRQAACVATCGGQDTSVQPASTDSGGIPASGAAAGRDSAAATFEADARGWRPVS